MKHRHNISRRAALTLSAGVYALTASGALAQTADAQVAEAAPIIIVTAQKRRETLQEIPQSVTVVSEEALKRRQADNFQDYLALVPGLSLQSFTPGVTTITLRGINSGGGGATVGVYVDEVPYGSSSGLANGSILAGDFDTLDIDRLEVLRGPQGTLYGSTSVGGLLKFVTNEPKFGVFEGEINGSIEDVSGGGLGYSGTGIINVPIADTLAFRASGFYRFDDGFIDSIGNNPIPDALHPGEFIDDGTLVRNNVNEKEAYGGRASLLFSPSDTLSVRLTALLQNTKSSAGNFYDARPGTLEPLYGERTQTIYIPEPTVTKYRVYSGTIEWDAGFANLTSSTSYATLDNNLDIDLTSGLAQLLTALAEDPEAVLGVPFPPLFGDPLVRHISSIQRQTNETDKFVQEVRLASPDNETLEWLVGAFYTHEDSAINQDLYAVEPGTTNIFSDLPQLGDVFLVSTYEEFAGFTNATWHIGPRFDLTVGGRVSHNKQDAKEFLDTTFLLGGVADFDDVRSSETVFTYTVAPRLELNDNAAIYARLATGYRPGGPNAEAAALPGEEAPDAPATYDSDTVTSYEVGLKGDWLDNTFSFEIAAYYLDWENIQLFAIINDTGVNTNGGTAVSKGVEFMSAMRPTPGLTFTFNGAYQDAYLTEDTPPSTGGFKGEPLPYVPTWSFNLGAQYEWAVMDDATAFVGGDLSFVDDRTSDYFARQDPFDPFSPLLDVPGRTTVDLRAGLETERWSLKAYVKNLTNARGVTELFGQGSYPNNAIEAGIIRPRTIGVSVGARF